MTGTDKAETTVNMKINLEKVRNKAMKRAKATDEAVRKSPYRAAGIALGMGALTGFFFGRHGLTKGE